MKEMRIFQNRLVGRVVTLFFVATVSVSIASCGWGPIEDDKHPDWPVFPDLASIHLKVTPLDGEVDFLEKGKHFIGRSRAGELTVFDDQLRIKRKLGGGYKSLKMAGSNRFYGYVRLADKEWVSRFDGFESDGVEVPVHPLKLYRESSEPDTDASENDRCKEWVDQLVAYKGGYKCAVDFSSYVVLQYADVEYGVNFGDTPCSFQMEKTNMHSPLDSIFPPDVVFKNCEFPGTLAYDTGKSSLKCLGTATRERTSSGNHFVFGYHLSGFAYYELPMGKETFRFKSYQNHISIPALSMLKSTARDKNGNPVIYLHDTNQQKLYRITRI